MADQIKKIEMRERGDGTYNQLLYPKTSSDLVIATSGKTVQQEIDDLKSSVSNGKNQIATAITGMGQSASGSDTFSQLATKIKDISKDANATVGQVLTGRTFYQGGVKRTGTMANRGAVTHTITTQNGSYTIPAGYHNGSGKVTATFSNLTAGNIRSGVNIGGVVGTLLEGTSIKSRQVVVHSARSNVSNQTASITPVNMNTSIVRYAEIPDSANYVYFPYNPLRTIGYELISSNTVRYHTGSDMLSSSNYAFEVIEFTSVKSLQRGYTSVTGTETSVNISTVNPEKCLVFITCRANNNGVNSLNGYTLTSTKLTFTRGNDWFSVATYWQIVEFN